RRSMPVLRGWRNIAARSAGNHQGVRAPQSAGPVRIDRAALLPSGSSMKKTTRVNHPPGAPVPGDNHPVVAPIYQTGKFEFESVEDTLRALRGDRAGYFYSRSSNPTNRQLELTLAELQGREDCIVCASGLGVVAQALLSLTKQGDHILGFIETYGPSRR